MTISFVSYQQMLEDVRQLSGMLPCDIECVYGVPRSGLMVAAHFALLRNISISHQSFRRCRDFGFQKRNFSGKVLVLDDTTDSGESLTNFADSIHAPGRIITASLYVNPASRYRPDYFVKGVPKPRFFEWNFMGHGEITHWAMIDMDGVICVDPTPEQNDDGDEYRKFLRQARPLYVPSRKVIAICTSRLEKYRPRTVHWLRTYGVEYGNLFMSPHKTANGRRKANDHARHKASRYKQCQHSRIFMESNPQQAAAIFAETGKPVFCVSTMELWQ